jgi:hypothetical protein
LAKGRGPGILEGQRKGVGEYFNRIKENNGSILKKVFPLEIPISDGKAGNPRRRC